MIARQPPPIPDHLVAIVSRYAEQSNRSYDKAFLHLLGTICSIVEQMDEGEIEGFMVRLMDGKIDEVLF